MERISVAIPVAQGPFQFVSWDEGEAWYCIKMNNTGRKTAAEIPLPYLDAVKITFFDNKATEFLQFRQGGLSFINDIDPSFQR
jgi:oligopeptide transport system substrate-binding protein